MRILLLSNKVPFPSNDGSTIAIRSMVDALLLNGATLSLISLNTKKHYRKPKEIEANLPIGLDFQAVDVDTDVKPLGAALNLISGQAYHVSRFNQPKMQVAIRKKLSEIKFDIIQLEGLSMAVYLPLIRKYSSAAVSMRAHNIEHLIWERHTSNETQFFKKKYLKLQSARLKKFELKQLALMDALVFITETDRDNYRSWAGKTISTAIPCGLNPEDYDHTIPEEFRYDLVHLASLDWLPNQQGLEWFLEKVWPLVLEARPKSRIAIGGRDMPKKIFQYANDNLWVFAEVDDAQRFIKAAKVAIIPLLAGSGMRIKLIEYMAMNQATVSTIIGAEGINLSANKEVLLADNAEAFAAAIILLLDNKLERENMAQAALKKFKEEYANRSLGQRLLQFYQTLV